MSFILDALKKSETDRQQQSTAEFASVPTSPAPTGVPRWLWVVGLLLAINIVILVGVLLRPEAETPAAVEVENTAGRSTPNIQNQQSAENEPPSFEAKVATARQNRPGQQTDSGSAMPGSMPGSARTGSSMPGSAAPEPVKPVLISQNPTTIPAQDLYPSIQEVRANGRLAGVPELHLDIHVYNSDPDDRFVFINMSKLREGSHLSEGPVVVKITPAGVVLSHQGQSFLLPRD